MNIYENTVVNKHLGNSDIITSSYFKTLIDNPFITLEGAYLTYQQSTNINIHKGILTPEDDVDTPEENDFYFNTDDRTEFKYSGTDWVALESSLLDMIVETGFSSSWIPITTLKRDNFIELTLPKDYLPINIDESVNIFIGFKDMVDSEKIISAMGIPLVKETSRFFSREVNTLIHIPIDFKCGFINLLVDSNIKKLEDPTIDSDLPTIGELLAKYNSESSDDSSVGAGNLSGTSLIF
jgi:hypothetical protein